MELNCDREELTCVGTFQMIHEGEMLEVQGEFVDHSAYGRQLKISSYSEKVPEDTMAIERYLGSDGIHADSGSVFFRYTDERAEH